MEIFGKELLAQFFKTVADTLYSLSSSILAALWRNIANFLPSMIAAIGDHDWGNVALHTTILLAIVVLVYRLVRRQVQCW